MADAAPSIYEHEPLLGVPDAIRLAVLQPGRGEDLLEVSLKTLSLSNDPYYEALSYTWRLPEDQIHHISVDGQPFPIQHNLWRALHALRDAEEARWLWIDYLSINQADVLERNAQVSLMGEIYKSALAVLVWLGPSDPDIDLAFDAAETAASGGRATNIPHSNSLNRLFLRNYWSRAWIIQELSLARQLVFHCGSRALEEDAFAAICASTWKAWQRAMHWPSSMKGDYSVFPAWSLLGPRQHTSSSKVEAVPDLRNLLDTYHSAECTEPRDRIYALLALAGDCRYGRGLQPDYSIPTVELVLQTLAFCEPQKPIDFALKLNQPCDEDLAIAKAMATAGASFTAAIFYKGYLREPFPSETHYEGEDCFDWHNDHAGLRSNTGSLGFFNADQQERQREEQTKASHVIYQLQSHNCYFLLPRAALQRYVESQAYQRPKVAAYLARQTLTHSDGVSTGQMRVAQSESLEPSSNIISVTLSKENRDPPAKPFAVASYPVPSMFVSNSLVMSVNTENLVRICRLNYALRLRNSEGRIPRFQYMTKGGLRAFPPLP